MRGAEIVRWQGNLFLVVLRGRPLSTLAGMMEDARTAMRERTLRLRGSGEPIGVVTMSGGVAVGVGVPLEDVLTRADMLRDLASGGWAIASCRAPSQFGAACYRPGHAAC